MGASENTVQQAYFDALGSRTVATEARLKSLAKWLKQRDGITHTEALDTIARRMGHNNWKALVRNP